MFLIVDITLQDFITDIEKIIKNRKINLKTKVDVATEKKKMSFIVKTIIETRTILRATNKENKFILVLVGAVICSAIGTIIASFLNNKILMLVLGFGFFMLPFWYIRLVSITWKKQLNGELETALSIITSSYKRNNDIIGSIEENISYINSPLKEVFQEFVFNTKINANTKSVLEDLKNKVNNDVFKEWVDTLILCQDNSELVSALSPILEKLSDVRIVSAELDNMMYRPLKEFFIMVIFTVCLVPSLYFIDLRLWNILLHTWQGKMGLVVHYILIFIAISGSVFATKPVEYKR